MKFNCFIYQVGLSFTFQQVYSILLDSNQLHLQFLIFKGEAAWPPISRWQFDWLQEKLQHTPISHTPSAIPRAPTMKGFPAYNLLVKVYSGVCSSKVCCSTTCPTGRGSQPPVHLRPIAAASFDALTGKELRCLDRHRFRQDQPAYYRPNLAYHEVWDTYGEQKIRRGKGPFLEKGRQWQNLLY